MIATVGQCRVLERIGAGGLGELYRATHTGLGRTVAVRRVAQSIAADPSQRRSLLARARELIGFSSPHIVELIEIHEEGDEIYLVSEYAAGETLRATLLGHPINPRRTVEIAIEVAQALEAAHIRGFTPVDLRPETVVITPKGVAKVLEIGFDSWTMAGAARRAIERDPTIQSALAASVARYMSPEQVIGDPGKKSSDFFALGILIFEMIAGRPPFDSATAGETAVCIAAAPTPLLSQVKATLPAPLDELLERLLAKPPASRPESLTGVTQTLRGIAAGMERRVPAAPAAARPGGTRHLGRVPAALVAALLMLAGIAWSWREYGDRFVNGVALPVDAPLLVVAPFVTQPPSQERRYFAGGIAEDLASRLGQVPGLQVVGRSIVRAGQNENWRNFVQQVGGAFLLEGAIAAGAGLDISVQLVNLRDGSTAWQKRYTAGLSETLRIQDEIARDVALQLRINPGNQPTTRSVNAAAYEEYLKGRDAAARDDLTNAVAAFERAVAADKQFAEAYAALAHTVYRASDKQASDPFWRTWIKQAAEKGAAIDPNLAEVQLALAIAAPSLVDSLRSIQKALEIDRSYAEAFRVAGDLVRGVDPTRALAMYGRALQLDPWLKGIHESIAEIYIELEQFKQAEQHIVEGRLVERTNPAYLDLLARTRLVAGQPLSAIETLGSEMPRGRAEAMATLAAALLRTGKTEQAWQAGVELAQLPAGSCQGLAAFVGLELESEHTDRSRSFAERALSDARRPDSPPTAFVCAAQAAAALVDVDEATRWLQRIAGSEEALRRWNDPKGGTSPDFALRHRLPPWTRITQVKAIQTLAQAVREARERLRVEIAPIAEPLVR